MDIQAVSDARIWWELGISPSNNCVYVCVSGSEYAEGSIRYTYQFREYNPLLGTWKILGKIHTYSCKSAACLSKNGEIIGLFTTFPLPTNGGGRLIHFHIKSGIIEEFFEDSGNKLAKKAKEPHFHHREF